MMGRTTPYERQPSEMALVFIFAAKIHIHFHLDLKVNMKRSKSFVQFSLFLLSHYAPHIPGY